MGIAHITQGLALCSHQPAEALGRDGCPNFTDKETEAWGGGDLHQVVAPNDQRAAGGGQVSGSHPVLPPA